MIMIILLMNIIVNVSTCFAKFVCVLLNTTFLDCEKYLFNIA